MADKKRSKKGLTEPKADYEIRYLPLALEDLEELFRYIAITREAPKAAAKLLADIDQAIQDLSVFPYAHRIYPFKKPAKSEYRKIEVKHQSIFYIVKQNIVEIHRVLYSGRDIETVLSGEGVKRVPGTTS